ncbi:MAG TPA: class I SAM-dependent methyltransferase [Amaricoccus sp.]|uniref:class I SAM-dependent methyltransferase n=1 Tax=Amaricoccus sp. TaxID=1872485 RepID=UPI002CDC9F6E|nr:class I SAM-dependent methyltransferase [Amaricoccus sp.]HMQ94644.1 class I SAM-dependent methyltransferase [Amaricoccus sp.]HMR51661.1 class I SAM-dependent methyltransferase [Amaricoccus sp.]HMR59060.1 class I SAM-dependent methyltransferase [Amaricoccus sp.]HMT98403.1 class I SAM-dependent methyltransferase [Amaricoccus sp.]
MAQLNFVRILQCPYCGGGLELETRHPAEGPDVEFGTLRCQCYRYGIVLGIVVLRQASPPNDNTDPIVAAIDKGDHDGAVDLMLAHEPRPHGGVRATIRRSVERLRQRGRPNGTRHPFPSSEGLHTVLRRWRPNYYGEYLEYRYANPSLLAALPVIAAMAKGLTPSGDGPDALWALDIGCGIGQTTYLLRSLVPGMRVVAADLDFLNLALAKHYVEPEGNFICFDAEAGLPFRDGVFDATFSLDCVHYIRGKQKLAAELQRTGRANALYALCHLHNVARANPNQGIPLSAEGYSRVFGRLGGTLYAEPALLESFTENGSLGLSLAAAKPRTDVADAFVYLGLGDNNAELTSTHLDNYMASGPSHFSLNRLYQGISGDGVIELRLNWPSEKLRSECCASFEPLRERVSLAAAFADAVLGQRFHELPAEIFEALVRSFVVVPQPAAFHAEA